MQTQTMESRLKTKRIEEGIIPLHDFVVIEPEEYKSDGGIVIPVGIDVDPDTQSKTGRVIAVGRGTLMDSGEFCDLETRPDDRVEYLVAVLKIIRISGKEYHVVRDRNVIFRYGE